MSLIKEPSVRRRLPVWLRRPLSHGSGINELRGLIQKLRLNTVCESAKCPNLSECFSRGTATFMILGDICTRRCSFCAIPQGRPLPIDHDEAEHLVHAVKVLKLKHVVITTVARDDLKDGGASHFAACIKALKEYDPAIIVEVLISDLRGNEEHLEIVLDAGPDILNHNIETVERLQFKIRPQASYHRSLKLLRAVKRYNRKIWSKSGLMLGFGETKEEVYRTLVDLKGHGCELLTIGQYLQPIKEKISVVEYIEPEQFKWYEEKAYEMGFSSVASGPFVRSSYHAENNFSEVK